MIKSRLVNLKKAEMVLQMCKKLTCSFAYAFLLSFSHVSNGYGQSFREFQNAKDIEVKIGLAYRLWSVYIENDIDSLKIVGELLIHDSKIKKSFKAKNYANLLLGTYYSRAGNVEKGLHQFQEARNYFAKTEDLNMVTDVCNQIGIAYQYMGKFEKATQWYHESLLYGYNSSFDRKRFVSKVNLALAFAESGEFKTAERHATEYLDWAYEIKSHKAIANAYASIGKICLMERYYNIAVGNFELGMIYAKKSASLAQLGHGYTNIGIVKYLEGDKKEALNCFKNALRLHKKVKTLNSILDAYLNLGGAYFELGDLENAGMNYQLGLDLAKKSNKYNSQVEFLNAQIELGRLKKSNTKQLEFERDLADTKHKEFLARVTKIDQLLDKDIRKKRPDNLIMTSKSKEFAESLILPVFAFFSLIILGQLLQKRLI